MDKGYSAWDSCEGDLTDKVVVTMRYNDNGNWIVVNDIDKLGEYVVWYNVADSSGNQADRKSRALVVRDTTKPVSTAVHTIQYSIEVCTPYVAKGYSAWDSFEGDLTDKVVLTMRYNDNDNWIVVIDID